MSTRLTLAELNAMDRDSAMNELRRCCGSTRWAAAMADARPFAGEAAMARTADEIWASLGREDWLEAFAAHPRIGADPGRVSAWSREEQAGLDDAMRDRLAALNRAYENRFGRIFIVCAAGMTGNEMVRALERRLRNDVEEELRAAVEEQRKITRLRLGRLTT